MTLPTSGRAFSRPLAPDKNPDLLAAADAARVAAKEAKRERARAMDALVDLLLENAELRAQLREANLTIEREAVGFDGLRAALREAYTLLVSAEPTLIRDAKTAPNETSAHFKALLRDRVREWLTASGGRTSSGDRPGVYVDRQQVHDLIDRVMG